MAHSFPNFKYSHTIEPPVVEVLDDEDDELEALFKFNSNYISKEREPSVDSEVEEVHVISKPAKQRSRSRSHRKKQKRQKRDRSDRKQKKDRKEKKDRDRKEKKDKKDKKDRKQKKEKKDKQQHKHRESSEESDKKSKKTSSVKQPQSILATITTSKHSQLSGYFADKKQQQLADKINSEFAYKQQIARGCLPFSVITFPQKGLYQYGLQMNEIPSYRRLSQQHSSQFSIIGLKPGKHSQQIIKDLNKKICQRESKEEQPIRYFSFFGLEGFESECIKRVRTRPDVDSKVIAFDNSYWADSSIEVNSLKTVAVDHRALENNEAQLLRINRQYNIELSRNPKDAPKWLQFIALQDRLHQNQQAKTLIERKLSIAEKALQSNPDSIPLVLAELNLLFQLKRQNYYTDICQRTLQQLNRHPESIELWRSYLDFKFSSFAYFTNSFVRKQFEAATQLLRKKTAQATSAMMIWKIRKASLYVLSKVVQVLKLEGYRELSTGICQALLEYNLFIPEKVNKSNDYAHRAEVFRAYWEDYQAYRVGELASGNCWEAYYNNTAQVQGATYLSHYEQKPFWQAQTPKNWLTEQFSAKHDTAKWRPSHMQHDQLRIEQSPESFVLFEDIQHLLQIYRDNENLQLLVDMFAEQLGMPPVFARTLEVDGEFAGKYVYSKLKHTVETDQLGRINIEDRLDLWSGYFHPKEAELLLRGNSHVRLVYLKRILLLLKGKMANTRPILNYLMFLQSVVYVNPRLQQLIYDDRLQQCKIEISAILELQPSNLQLWLGYIQAEYIRGGNAEECRNVYLQLFKLEGLTRKKTYTLLFNFYASLKRWQVNTEVALVRLLQFVKQHTLAEQHQQAKTRLSMFDVLQLQSLLVRRYQQFEHKTPGSKKPHCSHRMTKRHILSYFILQVGEMYEPSLELSACIQLIHQRLLRQSSQDDASCRVLLSVPAKLALPKFARNAPSLCYMQLLMRGFEQPTFMLFSYLSKHFEKASVCQDRFSLSYWMAAICFYPRSISQRFLDMFFQYGEQLMRGSDLTAHQAGSTIRFSKLIARKRHCPQLLFLVMDRVPYAKDIFLLYLKQCPVEQRAKIRHLLQEKELRVVFRE